MVWFSTVLCAQDPAAATREELAKLQHELLEAEARTQRLVDLRVRHDLGLPAAFAVYVELTDADRAMLAEPGASLEKEQREIERLVSQQDLLQHQVATARRENIQHAMAIARTPALVPPAVAPAPAGPEPARSPAGTQPAAQPQGARDPGGSRPPPEPAEPVKPVHLLRGSTNHRAVGAALFAAGRYEEALAELQLAVERTPAELGDLFQLARCFERLGKAEEARRWFLEIEARDTQPGAKGPEAGNWARSARAARQIMEWMQDRGSWQPAVPIEAIGAAARGN